MKMRLREFIVNKKIIFSLFIMLNAVFCTNAIAAFTVGGTRFIYDEGKKNISVEVKNNAKETYGGQVWIDNTNQPVGDVYFIPAPTLFKIDAEQKQIIRIININKSLPKDRESLFWLNVQEIPPVTTSDSSVLAIALNTQVKLFYRPTAIINGRNQAEKKLEVNGSFLKNPTPYYFAITAIYVNNKKLHLNYELDRKLGQMAPMSEINIGSPLIGNVKIEAIDDYGARREYTLT